MAVTVLMLALTGCHGGPTRAYVISDASVEPMFHRGQRLLVSSSYYSMHPMQDDDVIAYERGGAIRAGRVSGVPGQMMEIRDGVLFRDDRPVATLQPTAGPGGALRGLENVAPQRVSYGTVFVDIDNRARDARGTAPQYGLVDIKDVLGRVVRTE